MAKKPGKHGRPWSTADVEQLRRLAARGTAASAIAAELERTQQAVRAKATALGITLRSAEVSTSNAGTRSRGPLGLGGTRSGGTRSRGPLPARRRY